MLTLLFMLAVAAPHFSAVAPEPLHPSRFRLAEPVSLDKSWSLPQKMVRQHSIVDPIDTSDVSRQPRATRLHPLAGYALDADVDADVFSVRNGGGGGELAIGFTVREPFNP